jgi:hypothetical protein
LLVCFELAYQEHFGYFNDLQAREQIPREADDDVGRRWFPLEHRARRRAFDSTEKK